MPVETVLESTSSIRLPSADKLREHRCGAGVIPDGAVDRVGHILQRSDAGKIHLKRRSVAGHDSQVV